MATDTWAGPGVMFTFVDLKGQSKVSEETLLQWFDTEWIPGLLATGVITLAWLYKAVNPDYDKQHLVVYKVSDLALVHAGKLKQVPRSSPSGIFPGEVDDHVEFESRIYSFVQLYETSKQDEGIFSPISILRAYQRALTYMLHILSRFSIAGPFQMSNQS